MPTIGEVYNPLVEFAVKGLPEGLKQLVAVGKMIFENNPNRCPSIDDGIKSAKRNLDYYCQYFDEETAQKVKEFYELGAGFRTLTGVKLPIK